jgi:hypothetical protein
VRAGAFALALLLWGCGNEPAISCLKEAAYPGAPRLCFATCPEGFECFQRKEAHCFRNGPLECAPTLEECEELRLFRKGTMPACRLTPSDEL